MVDRGGDLMTRVMMKTIPVLIDLPECHHIQLPPVELEKAEASDHEDFGERLLEGEHLNMHIINQKLNICLKSGCEIDKEFVVLLLVMFITVHMDLSYYQYINPGHSFVL